MATVDFIHFCQFAFWDAAHRPCLIGLIGSIVRPLPTTIPILTVAIGLRLKRGEAAHINVEIGPANEPPARHARFELNGPPESGTPEGLIFLPFQTVQLYFSKPHTLIARVLEGDNVIGTKELSIWLPPGVPPESTSHPAGSPSD